MRIILSRKGFDSASGGCPSPILPDGRLRCLPIPDNKSAIKYESIYSSDQYPTGKIVESLTKRKIAASSRAHLDPDIDPDAKSRDKNWRGVFGQCGASQSHLDKQGVEIGDIFLFFGLFRKTEKNGDRLIYTKQSHNVHVLWGWMQIEKIIRVDNASQATLAWCREHPHIFYPNRTNNVIYIASKETIIPGAKELHLPGAGAFQNFDQGLQLTAEESDKPSIWRLPAWFSPQYGKSLSYHTDTGRWQRCERYHNKVLLESVGRGQEFVIDISDEILAKKWLAEILNHHSRS